MTKITFDFQFQFSEIYVLFSVAPHGFLIFGLPADEATAKSVTKLSQIFGEANSHSL